MTTTVYDRMWLSRRAGRVRRFHACDLIKPENDAEHTFNVLNLLMFLTDGDPGYGLMVAALTHDMGELRTGDIPGNIKHEMPASNWVAIKEMTAILEIHPGVTSNFALTPFGASLLKLADNLDGLIKCLHERSLGNEDIVEAGWNYHSYVRDIMGDLQGEISTDAVELVEEVLKRWTEWK